MEASALIADAGQGDGCEATNHLIGQVPLISEPGNHLGLHHPRID